jgi:hypothetical protein
MVGLHYEGQNKELSTTSTDLKKVLMWFQKNNKLYEEFFSNFETFIGHFEPLSASSSFAGKDVGKVLPPSVHPHMIKPVPLQLYLQFPIKVLPQFAHHVYLLVLLGI